VIVGNRIGKYELVALLSVGGMAEVHLACITGPGGFRKFLVLKRILPELREDENFVEMFKAEARLTASLSHSNIAQVFDFGEEGEHLFLAMEFIHGIELIRAIRHVERRNERVPVGLAVRVVRDLCLALHYGHTWTDPFGVAKPVIHRDVTPRNVMLSHSGTVKVIDFGIAKVDGAVVRTTEGTVKGSAGYMSPEQVVGQPLDGRSDLFSAGVILHELLTGRRLYSASGAVEAMRRTVLERPAAPSSLVPGLPKELSDIALQALEIDVKKRFATGLEMAKALEQAAGSAMLDEGSLGAWVRHTFPEQLAKTRSLLESLEKKEDAALRAIAGSLKAEEEAPSKLSDARIDLANTPTAQLVTPIDQTRGATILAVDDSGVGQKVVAAAMGHEGFKVMTCGSGAEALEMLKEIRPDLVITDVRMPEMDGFELCEKIRHDPSLQHMPVVFLSASCSVEERARGLSVGGDDFVRKPFDAGDLATRIRGHLQRVAVLRKPQD
jgi:serine/threonine-protein kinase